MAEDKAILLIKAAKELNVGTVTIRKHLETNGFELDPKPTVKLSQEMYDLLLKDFQSEKLLKEESEKIEIGKVYEDTPDLAKRDISPKAKKEENEEFLIQTVTTPNVKHEPEQEEVKEEEKKKEKKVEKEEEKAEEKKPDKVTRAKAEKLAGPTVVGKIDLESVTPKKSKGKDEKVGEENKEADKHSRKLVASSSESFVMKRKKRLIKVKSSGNQEGEKDDKDAKPSAKKAGGRKRIELNEKEIQEQVKSTLAKLTTKSKGPKYRKAKKERAAERESVDNDEKLLQVTEFISVSELGSLMDVAPTEVLTECMNLGVVVSINQRLDAELIELVADEFGFSIEFIGVDEQDENVAGDEDAEEDLVERPPIVVVMGHVDHGKTKLLDQIRKTNIVDKEAGGITQHIGAYSVQLENGKKITFLDTPGHEAFTAMRSRGAKITDIAVIVIAADEDVKPQTKEAISHAQAAGVNMIFALNKIDKPGANPEKVKETLSGMNILLEDWGGKYQSQEISAKENINIDLLLEKILLEAELLELKANPNRNAVGTLIEATLDKGKGYVSTILVQKGTLRKGDMLVVGSHFGRVKALMDENENPLEEAGPSSPALVLGLSSAPQAGENVKVYDTEQEAKAVANNRLQIVREQTIRTSKHITLDEIGRRLALGSFKELNVIIKGDVDGSVEALSDSLIELSTDEVVLNVVHKGVGQISESDILLATASAALVVG
ncbi:MAG: translation initiation factor IF-2, partial [Bacteroidetes bacterium]|nr:translation initiation factor IF-2 [Bacteroidota bacterium]